MSISPLDYTKDWTNAEDFPTVQTDENQVRADQQFLFNEIKAYLNDTLIPGIESAIAVACKDLVVGQLTAGSVTKDKLSEALIEVLSRAELGGDLDARINAESAKRVSKSGDTMSGSLKLDRANGALGYGTIYKHNDSVDYGTKLKDADAAGNSYMLNLCARLGRVTLEEVKVGESTKNYNLLHSGNLSDNGVAKIATGSYTGTGVCGEKNPNSITFPFVPKVVMICGDGTQLLFGTDYGAYPVFGVLWDQLSSEYKSIANNRYSSMSVKATDKTLSWYSNKNDSYAVDYQLNTSGTVYRYVAFG